MKKEKFALPRRGSRVRIPSRAFKQRAFDVTGSPFYRFFFRNKNMKKLLVDFEKM